MYFQINGKMYSQMDRMYSCRAVRGAFAKGCVYVAHPTPWLGQLKPNANAVSLDPQSRNAIPKSHSEYRRQLLRESRASTLDWTSTGNSLKAEVPPVKGLRRRLAKGYAAGLQRHTPPVANVTCNNQFYIFKVIFSVV